MNDCITYSWTKSTVLILALAALVLTGCARQDSVSVAHNGLMMLVGTYTYDGSHGIYSYRFNPQTDLRTVWRFNSKMILYVASSSPPFPPS